MKTYHDAYIEAYEKCRKARDAGKRFIEVRPWRDTYRLYAHTEYKGWLTYGQQQSICTWAENIAKGIAHRGWCELPNQGENAQ